MKIHKTNFLIQACLMISLALSLRPSPSHAATILIVTDDPLMTRANEIEQLLRTTAPFSLLENLSIKIEKTEELKCKSNGNTVNNRDLECSRGIITELNSDLRHLVGLHSADRVILVSKQQRWAGTARSFVTSVASAGPVNVALHELLHTFNFVDEYAYADGVEADTFCGGLLGTGLGAISTGPNLAVFNDRPPYTSDAQAKAMHSRDIPWFAKISPKTKITNGTELGTSEANVIGLYKSMNCVNYKNAEKKTWKPSQKPTVMEFVDTSYIPEATWADIARALGTKLKIEKIPSLQKSEIKSNKGLN